MKIFINDGICKRKGNGNVKVEKLPDSRLRLWIPNYLESEKRHEYIKFTFSNISSESLTSDILLDNVSLARAGKNTYYTVRTEEKEQTHMYALLRSTAGDWDDIFIPRSLKEKVKVLRRIRFLEDESDGKGKFLSNIYLIKIKLDIGERIPIYFAYAKNSILKAYYPIYRPRWDERYHVGEKMKTLIFITKKNQREYISLSNLCE